MYKCRGGYGRRVIRTITESRINTRPQTEETTAPLFHLYASIGIRDASQTTDGRDRVILTVDLL